MTTDRITSLLREERVFYPSEEVSSRAYVRSLAEYRQLWQEAYDDPAGFWARYASELHWFRPWDSVLEWEEPYARWFVGGLTNLCYNCVDRHLSTWRRNKTALIWVGEPGEERLLRYQDLYREVCRFASVLKKLGIGPGDRVSIYMPLVPEAVIAMLACARIGAVHSVVFGGFSAEALADRNNDAGSRLLITADGGYRRGQVVPLKENADEALRKSPTVERCIVFRRTGQPVRMVEGRDLWWDELMKDASESCPAEPLNSEHMLYLLYTSGTTGKPKGIIHTTGGYMVGTYLTTKWVFDLKDEDTYWCTADIGWVTGHSYSVYGPLANGATVVLYEGAPNWPDPGRFWSIVEKYRVTIFYTAPTAIRSFMKWGDEWVQKYDLSSLRVLGTVGEPINPEAWMWYRTMVGGGRCPIVDTWWQTETGMIMISPLPGATPTKPGSTTFPFPGVVPDVVTRSGEPVGVEEGGYLVLRRPWPAMLRGIYGDPKRYEQQYWGQIPHCYFTGDGARRDRDGYFWIVGRVDDVLNVSGHRLSTMEIESALVSHPAVAEAAAVGKPHEIKGEAVVVFVTLRTGYQPSAQLAEELRQHVRRQIGAHAQPDEVRFAEILPKTRSGKIMRRLLRDVAAGRPMGDTTTLEDFSVLARLRQEQEEE
jgi:acetyl-CoA synthetase